MTASAPPPRNEHGAAYDAARAVVVIFGGASDVAQHLDTWEFDGVDWREVAGAALAGPVYTPLTAYDPVSERVIRVGGLWQCRLPR
jgi:hypothetical protein